MTVIDFHPGEPPCDQTHYDEPRRLARQTRERNKPAYVPPDPHPAPTPYELMLADRARAWRIFGGLALAVIIVCGVLGALAP